MGRSKAAPRDIRAADRRATILADRAAGLTYQQLASKHGISVRRVREILDEEFVRLTDRRNQVAVEALQINLRRLDDLLQAVWEPALEGDLEALKAALAVIDRQNKMLGIGVLQERDVSTNVNVLINLEERARSLGLSLDQLRGPAPALPGPSHIIEAEVVD